jgi:uncharacterized protein YukE
MASGGYEVEPAALHAAAGEVRSAGQPLHTAHAAVTGQIGAAVAMNMGYETASALSRFGHSVRNAARRAQQRLDDHADAFQQCAKNYEDQEKRSEEGFKAFLRA